MSTSIRYLRMYLHLPAGNRRAIGYLSQYGDILRVSFDADYLEDINRPLLSLGYVGLNEEATRQIMTAPHDVRMARSDGKWPVYFENLLPEGHNRDRLALERGCTPEDEFELLAAAGHDLMGALEVEPVPSGEDIPNVVRHWHTALGLDALEPGFVEFPVEDAAAIPGVVTKFSALQDGRRYIVKRHGAAGDTILKLPSTAHPDLVDNENTGYRLCRAVGLDCAEAAIISSADADLPDHIPFNDILAVKRFDRGAGGQRIHFEEFAQVLQYAPRNKYGKGITHDFARMINLLNTLSADPVRDVRQFISRFVTFILMGNSDAHLKNWGILYRDGRTPQLAPVYDPVCVSAFFESVPETHYAMNRGIDKTLRAFTWQDLENLLDAAHVLRPQNYVRLGKQVVKQAQANWPSILDDGPAAVKRSVTERLHGGVALSYS